MMDSDAERPLQKRKSDVDSTLKKKKKKLVKGIPSAEQTDNSSQGFVLALNANETVREVVASPQKQGVRLKATRSVKKVKSNKLDIGSDGYGILVHNHAAPDDDVVENETPIIHVDPPLVSSNDILEDTPAQALETHQSGKDPKEPAPENATEINDENPSTQPSEATAIAVVLETSAVPKETTNGVPNAEETGVEEDFDLFEMASLAYTDPPSQDEDESPQLVNVHGYKVAPQFATTAQSILTKYGDIAADTSFALSLRSHLVEKVCAVYQKLEKSTFSDLSLAKLESMRQDIADCVKTNMKVTWLAERLDEIYNAKKTLKDIASSRAKNSLSERIVTELSKELELQKAIVEKGKQKIEDIEKKLKTEKAKCEASNQAFMEAKRTVQKFHNKSLLGGM